MKSRRSFAALAAVLSASACAPMPEQDARDFLRDSSAAVSDYQRGKRDLEAGNYGLALDHFAVAVERDPDNIAALNGKAIALAKLDRDDEAQATFDQALQRDETSAVTRSNYAIFANRHGVKTAAQHDAATPPPKLAEAAPQPPDMPQPARADGPADGPAANFVISNASGQYRLAHRLQQYLSGQGITAGRVANAMRYDRTQSILLCHAQSRAAAETIRRALPSTVKLVVLASKASSIELVAGRDLNNFDAKLARAGTTEAVR